jgi:hypothetical protein
MCSHLCCRTKHHDPLEACGAWGGMSWGEGPEATVGQTIFLTCVALVVFIYVVLAVYFVGLYVVQRRNLYISYRCPELLVTEVSINALCVVVIGLREAMALNPPGQRLSCTATRFFTVLNMFVNNTSQVRRGQLTGF